MIYLDASAVMKLIREEAESGALQQWLHDHREYPAVSSELCRIEVLRASRRLGERVLTEARLVVADLDLVPLDRAVQDLACDVGGPLLRTLDVLHLASALLLGDALRALVVYDERLAAAAGNLGLEVAMPGRSEYPRPG